jgi:hypothetical protein
MSGAIHPLPQYAFMAWCFVKARGQFYLNFKATDAWIPSSAEIKHVWSYASTPSYVFMAWCLVKHGDNFIHLPCVHCHFRYVSNTSVLLHHVYDTSLSVSLNINHSNTILPSTPRSSEWSLSLRFSDQNFVCLAITKYIVMPRHQNSGKITMYRSLICL